MSVNLVAGIISTIMGATIVFTKHFHGKGGDIYGFQAQGVGICFVVAGVFLISISIKKKGNFI